MSFTKSWLLLAAISIFPAIAFSQDYSGESKRRPNEGRQSGKQDETYIPVSPSKSSRRSEPAEPVNSAQEDPQDAVLNNQIDELLTLWCKKTGNDKSVYAEFERVIEDVAFNTKEKSPGSARFVKPNKARLDVTKGESAESFVFKGDGEIWHYRPPLKSITVYELPKPQRGQEAQESPVPFLFGQDPQKARERYIFKILDETNDFIHVKILPKRKDDKKDFKSAEVWLNRKTFFPDRLVFLEPNGNKITFDFKNVVTNVEIKDSDFDTPVPRDPTLNKLWALTRLKSDAAKGSTKGSDSVTTRKPALDQDGGESRYRNPNGFNRPDQN